MGNGGPSATLALDGSQNEAFRLKLFLLLQRRGGSSLCDVEVDLHCSPSPCHEAIRPWADHPPWTPLIVCVSVSLIDSTSPNSDGWRLLYLPPVLALLP